MSNSEKPKDLVFMEGISHLVFNKDFTQCALSKKDNKIYIYQVKNFNDPNSWILLHCLKAHFLYVSGLDWCPATNRIVSCSYDKTCMIWEFVTDKWTGMSLTATSKLSYLFAKWNDRGDKFVTGTSEKKLFMGYFSSGAGWWTGRNIKGHKSSVVCARIDPSSIYCISGSTDMKVLVTSCYEPTIDDPYLGGTQGLPFGTVVMEVECNSWINSVCWNASGAYSIAAAQDANIYIINHYEKQQEVIPLQHGAVSMVIPKGENDFYAVGFDRHIYLYSKESGQWEMKKKITDSSDQGTKSAAAPAKTGGAYTGLVGGIAEKMKKFETFGVNKKTSIIYKSVDNKNLHKSIISSFVVKDNKIITCDVSGFVKFWNV